MPTCSSQLRRIGFGKRVFLPLVWLLLWGFEVFSQEQCAVSLTFTPAVQPATIGWDKFPDFTLPFPVIYGGPRFNDVQAQPLRHGFSHLAQWADAETPIVPPTQRALLYYGVAYGLGQPWETLQSPWQNDTTAYQAKWEAWLKEVSGQTKNPNGLYRLPAAWLALDIERALASDAAILRLKTQTATPDAYRSLTDAAFLSTYKRDMQALYAQAARYIRQHADLTQTRLTAYNDAPILPNYLNVTTYTWADLTTNTARLNYLFKDEANRAGGPYDNQLDALSTSAYYFYDYPNPLANDYLGFLLFQIEANRAWTTKPVMPWLWLRYHDGGGAYPNFVQPFMAEASAIFPIFSGAAGVWLWDDPTLPAQRPADVYAAYEHFTHGLYRLSQFSDMLKEPFERVIETPARDLMAARQPIWRGIVKDNSILIAAHNPYATQTQTTSLTVRYKNWAKTLTLNGREVYLCRFDLNAVTPVETPTPDVQLGPNPADTELMITLSQTPTKPLSLALINPNGQVVRRQNLNAIQTRLSVADLPPGLYVLRIETQTYKVVIK